MDMSQIQKKLSDAFENSRMTFDDLSFKTNIPKSALHRYMTGETPKIPLDRFEIICKALGLDASETLGWYTWNHTIHELPRMEVPEGIIIGKEDQEEEEDSIDQDEEKTYYSNQDKARIYQALGALGRVDMDSAVTLFKTLVEKNVL